MAIRVQIPPDPFAEASWTATPIVIESSASRQLESELRRYCRREVDGRSFLIAGHRGAGKTTLVNHAIQRIMKESVAEGYLTRPLIVRLHGPNLLRRGKHAEPAAAEAAAAAQNAPAATSDETAARLAAVHYMQRREQAANAESDDTLRRVQTVLQQITLSLYRSLASDVVTNYRARVTESVVPPHTRSELLERAAQLELELDQYPTPDRLRDFWRAGRFLESGVLFPRRTTAPGVGESIRRRPDGQGYLELVALLSASHAYGRVSGTFEKAELKQSINAASSSSVGIEQKGQDIISPLVSIFTGGLTGTGVYLGADSAAAGTFAGIAAAIGAAAVFKYTATQSRSRTYSTEFTFLPDLRVATLDRALPVLISRLAAAGLVPVFVIDELDKIEDLYGDLEGIVRHVKNIVAEKAFFCFLTDRNYYERVVNIDVNDPYPKHYTYFTDRVFVSFQAPDLHNYVRDILRVDGADPAAGAVQEAAAEPATIASERADDEADLEVLPYVLLRRAEMHTIALRRQLVGMRGVDNALLQERGSIRSSPGYRFDLLVQFAIELILHRPRMLQRLRDDPAFSRLAHDALYYPVRLLQLPAENGGHQDGTQLDLSDSELAGFEKYLIARMSSERDDPGESSLKLRDADPALLFEDVRELASLLSDPWALLDELARSPDRAAYPRAVRDALPLNPPTGPLLRGSHDGRHVYYWRYDRDWNLRVQHERTPLAHQLDLYMMLAVRLVMLRVELDVPSREHAEAERQLRTVLWLPHRLWLDDGEQQIAVRGKSFQSRIGNWAPALAETPQRRQFANRALDELGRLLSDHGSFFGALNESGLRGPYGPLLARLTIPQTPLLRVEGSTWHFRYDANGYPAPDNTEADAWAAARVDWEDDVDFVTTVARAIGDPAVASGTGELLTLGVLANLHVLPTSPPWSAVESALQRLERYRTTRVHYAEFQADTQSVAEYVRMLIAHRRTLSAALLVGGVVGRGAGPAPAPAVIAGLRTVAQAYRFDEDPDEPVAATYERLQSTIVHRYPVLVPLAEPMDEPGEAATWVGWLRRLTDGLASTFVLDEERLAETRVAAWAEWRNYLGSLADEPGATFVAGLDGLISRAAGTGPCVLLKDDLESMTMADWSDAWYAAIRPDEMPHADAPSWLAERAAVRLGLFASETSLKKALLVRSAGSSLTAAWTPVPPYGVVSWTPAQLAAIEGAAAAGTGALDHLRGLDHVFIEHGPPQAAIDAAIEFARRFGRTRGAPPAVVMFTDRASERPAPWASRTVYNPAGLADLFRVFESVRVKSFEELAAPLRHVILSGGVLHGELQEMTDRAGMVHSGQSEPVQLEFVPLPNGTLFRMARRGRRIEAELRFEAERLLRAGTRLDREYGVVLEGARLRVEQVAAAVRGSLRLPPFLAPADMLELTLGADGTMYFDVTTRVPMLGQRRYRGVFRPIREA